MGTSSAGVAGNVAGPSSVEVEPSARVSAFLKDSLPFPMRSSSASTPTSEQYGRSGVRGPSLDDDLSISFEPPAVLVFPEQPIRWAHFRSLQKWEGVVLDIQDDVFLARLVDLGGLGPDEEAEIYREEVSRDDLDLLEPGAVFYWNIGYRTSPAGQRTRASEIRFRRLPVWTAEEIEAARIVGDRWFESFDWK